MTGRLVFETLNFSRPECLAGDWRMATGEEGIVFELRSGHRGSRG